MVDFFDFDLSLKIKTFLTAIDQCNRITNMFHSINESQDNFQYQPTVILLVHTLITCRRIDKVQSTLTL